MGINSGHVTRMGIKSEASWDWEWEWSDGNGREWECCKPFPHISSCDIGCAEIISLWGQVFPSTNKMRYLGVHIIKSRVFRCSLTMAKRSFYRAANSIFGKVGRIASEEVTLHLLETKCIPVLLYGLEACPLSKNQLSSIDFVVNRLFLWNCLNLVILLLSMNVKKCFLFSCRVSV